MPEDKKIGSKVLFSISDKSVKVLICYCDGLTGFPAAIEAVYPQTKVQLCIVHRVRQSLRFVGCKEHKTIAADLRQIYGAATLGVAEKALTSFAEKWDAHYPSISQIWLRH